MEREAGILYGAFGDKHQLFLRTFDDHSTALVEAVRRALDGPDAVAYERLRAHVLAVANATASDVCRRGCLLAKGTAELSEHDPAVAATARKAFATIEELISSCIAGAQRAGDSRQDADPARLAGLLLAVLRGIEALGKGAAAPTHCARSPKQPWPSCPGRDLSGAALVRRPGNGRFRDASDRGRILQVDPSRDPSRNLGQGL
ncbi:MAG TPA: TetR family transcriptional regulator C-terminal domain-containing protein [Trebonia sp.]|nr:TetR family transcriptional regulator C-terminal domain-containing protein [Trebonia sp.]